MTPEYVHGYSPKEDARLLDQASALTELLHGDTGYPSGSIVLEAGCGVGAQTVMLASQSPQAAFISVDISPVSLEQAKARVQARGLANVTFQQADLFVFRLPRRISTMYSSVLSWSIWRAPRRPWESCVAS